jgi:two-component system sensor histidine kinase KdpD
MISHELRTPLTSIKGFLSTLLAEDVQWTPEQQREFLEISDTEADKLTDLVEQLLEVSRLQAGTLSVNVRRQKLGDILGVAMPQLQTISRNHQLDIRVDEGSPILADEQRIAQVLVNLVDNAAKYSPPQTKIVVTSHTEDGHVQVDVRDVGSGIRPEDREIVFEAFRQVRMSSTQRGAGLGLAICKGLVEAHGGRIWIGEIDGPGTLISFTVPSA